MHCFNSQYTGPCTAANDFTDLLQRLQTGSNTTKSDLTPQKPLQQPPNSHQQQAQHTTSNKAAKQPTNTMKGKPPGVQSTPPSVQEAKHEPAKSSPSLAEAAQALSKLKLASSPSSPAAASITGESKVPYTAKKSPPVKPSHKDSAETSAASTPDSPTAASRKKSPSKQFTPSVAAMFASEKKEAPVKQPAAQPRPALLGRGGRNTAPGSQQQQQHPLPAPGQRLPVHPAPVHKAPLLSSPYSLVPPFRGDLSSTREREGEREGGREGGREGRRERE